MTRPDEFRTRVHAGLAAHPVGHDYEGDEGAKAFARNGITIGRPGFRLTGTERAAALASVRAAIRAVGERYLVDEEEG